VNEPYVAASKKLYLNFIEVTISLGKYT